MMMRSDGVVLGRSDAIVYYCPWEMVKKVKNTVLYNLLMAKFGDLSVASEFREVYNDVSRWLHVFQHGPRTA